jgi:hypothetical protein
MDSHAAEPENYSAFYIERQRTAVCDGHEFLMSLFIEAICDDAKGLS